MNGEKRAGMVVARQGAAVITALGVNRRGWADAAGVERAQR